MLARSPAALKLRRERARGSRRGAAGPSPAACRASCSSCSGVEVLEHHAALARPRTASARGRPCTTSAWLAAPPSSPGSSGISCQYTGCVRRSSASTSCGGAVDVGVGVVEVERSTGSVALSRPARSGGAGPSARTSRGRRASVPGAVGDALDVAVGVEVEVHAVHVEPHAGVVLDALRACAPTRRARTGTTRPGSRSRTPCTSTRPTSCSPTPGRCGGGVCTS